MIHQKTIYIEFFKNTTWTEKNIYNEKNSYIEKKSYKELSVLKNYLY